MLSNHRLGVLGILVVPGILAVKELKAQFVSALFVILTVAAVISAGINLQQQKQFRLPEDGVTWVDRVGEDGRPQVEALHLVEGSSADRAGIRVGDVLLRINSLPIERAVGVAQALIRLGAWQKADYAVRRAGVELKASVIISERVPDRIVYYQYLVGAVYLAIGLFVYVRRGRAANALHFYIVCLASFVLSTFHYTGKLNNFDKVIYWGNVAAGVFAPTIFLHFCLAFPATQQRNRRRVWMTLLYLPATVLLGLYLMLASGTLRIPMSPIEVRWLLDRVWLVFLSALYLLGAWVLTARCNAADDPVMRQQIKWLRNGALLGVLPFTLGYVLPYLIGVVPTPLMKATVLFLPLTPLTWAYAILRHRLMDVDVIFQQGFVYTLATLAVLAIFYGLVFSLGGEIENLAPMAVVALILIATFVFQPIRNWIQEVLDRHYFYKDRYDYRRTLVEFARELGSETDLDTMLQSAADRLLRTLSIQHAAFFLSSESDDSEREGRFELKMAGGARGPLPPPETLDLSFLVPDLRKPYLFIERTRHPLDALSHDWPASVRQTIAALDLTYYVPCTVRGRTIAYLGASRTTKGDFLSSEDLELLITMCGSVGIAVENSRLYRSLQRKVEQYERLKEYSENIVESINVGILAVDLEDRVESWNTQIERLTGIPRRTALGRRLQDLFPGELCGQFDKVRGDYGIHHIYKFVLRPDAMPMNVRLSPGNGNGNSSAEPTTRQATLNVAIAPLISRDFHQIGRLIIFDDITDRSELERRLVEADKLSSIGLLAAGVAHEVNTPLAVISTYAQMLAKQVGGDEQKSKLLEKIAKQTFRASEIVNSLLNFSRTSRTEFDEVDLNRIIRETMSLIDHQLEKAGISVQLEMEETLPAMKGNAGKLQQVFLNLFLNARDAMESGGVLRVRTWSEDGLARAEVIDSGKGIPSEHISRIYDPFFTTKGAKKGTGLGLAVTYGIVKEHGGSIEVHSEPGAGSRFRVDLPVARSTVNA